MVHSLMQTNTVNEADQTMRLKVQSEVNTGKSLIYFFIDIPSDACQTVTI